MFFDEKVNEGVSEENQKRLRDMSVPYHVYGSKIHKRRILKKSRICEIVLKRAALLAHSSFIVLKQLNLSSAIKNYEISFLVKNYL